MYNSKDAIQLNDPLYGFITIPKGLIFDLLEHPYFQRLRRISQMGMSYAVFPGAHHTRFLHALGAMHLAQLAVLTLRNKGVSISAAEAEALCAAILLHDIGHGPFSHAMEHSIVEGVDHEYLSLYFMNKLNLEMNGKLDLTIKIFTNTYERPFFHQIISSQLDIDRMDYLGRDSFYTGVTEGAINVERLIAMWDVKDGELVVEEKGIYSVESFLLARRLMYWQVYYHKASVVSEQLLAKMLKRAKYLVGQGLSLPASKALNYFLVESVDKEKFTDKSLEYFAALDDSDIITAMKEWRDIDDFILSNLSKRIIDRDYLKIEFSKSPIKQEYIEQVKADVKQRFNLSDEEVAYFVFDGVLSNTAYSMEENPIYIMDSSGEITDVAKASEQLNLKILSEKVEKYFLCYPKM